MKLPTPDELRLLTLAELIPVRNALALRADRPAEHAFTSYEELLDDALASLDAILARDAAAPEWIAELNAPEPEEEPTPEDVVAEDVVAPEPEPEIVLEPVREELQTEDFERAEREEARPDATKEIEREEEEHSIVVDIDSPRIDAILRKLVAHGLSDDDIWEVFCLANLDVEE